MISIDTRPDLIKLLIELNHYNCKSVKDNQIIIEIPQFKNKTNDPWYGLVLVCKPNRTNIDMYISRDETGENIVYVDSFDEVKSLDELITLTINKIKVCSKCSIIHELNDIVISGSKYMCIDCVNNIRSAR